MRNEISAALKQAMKDKNTDRLSTLRLISAAIKDRDIAARSDGNDASVSDEEVLAILVKMVKQRQESARVYEEGNRLDLSERELAEIVIIEEFLPRQLGEEKTDAAIAQAISETGADSIRDMGKVMGILKTRYTGQIDFGAAGAKVKAALTGN
ncbi:GatB/YqeY domain-containing protein [uncultured Lentibacter sp.]|uniref:GatB/YqeY domain-containing protein n=1 Tax=uncultured Lentibacter sp. TaxID=1659309 RepID=UPI00262AE464|nr:GatB/YqeY domain-containing protein [uncultured Lentibacter sp.]MCW1956006.1 GatB/YqeY domain-containing protein [Roseobacter sp.]